MVEPLSSFRREIKYPTSHSILVATVASKKSRCGVHPLYRGNRKRNDDFSNIQSFVQVKNRASSQKRLHLGPLRGCGKLKYHWGAHEYNPNRTAMTEMKLWFLWLRKSHHKHISIILYDANYVMVFYPKRGIMHKLNHTKGEFETPYEPSRRWTLKHKGMIYLRSQFPCRSVIRD